jgi:hypothetical protein
VTAPTQPAAPPNGSGGKNAPKVILRPFRIGVQNIDDEVYDVTVTLSHATQSLTPQYDIPSTGFLNDVYLLVENTVTATAAATGLGAPAEDAPFSVIDAFTFTDTNSAEIIGPISGWELMIISKWGGYCFNDDPRANGDLFQAPTSATAIGNVAGGFSFVLRVPLELVPRDALGSQPNKSSSTPFRIKISVAPLDAVYTNSATPGGSCRFRMMPKSYWEPTATDGSGNRIAEQPPGVNTTQYWTVNPVQGLSGPISVPMPNAVGFPVRNLGFVLASQEATPSRAKGETDWPSPFRLQVQSNITIDRLKQFWKKQITEDWGYTVAGDGPGQKDNGVYFETYCKDFAHKPGWETRRGYFRTTDGMRVTGKGTVGTTGYNGPHTLRYFVNYVGIGANASLAQLTT